MAGKQRFLVIDGNSLGKASHGAGIRFSNSQGLKTGVCFLFMRTFKMLLKENKPDMTFVAWDSWPTWRHQALPEYKASRKGNEDYSTQRLLLQELLGKLNRIVQVKAVQHEADDIAADLVRQNPQHEFILVTEDSDWFQLVNENVSIYRHKKKDYVTHKDFYTKTGHKSPEELVEFKSLIGDATDEIPGIKIPLADAVAHIRGNPLSDDKRQMIDEYKASDTYKRMRSLIELRDFVIPSDLVQCVVSQWDPAGFILMLEKLEFNSFLKDLDSWRKLMA